MLLYDEGYSNSRSSYKDHEDENDEFEDDECELIDDDI